MKIIPQWRRAWRMFSVQAMAAAGVLQVAWETHPEAIKAVVPASWVPWITVCVLLFGIAGRLVAQKGVIQDGGAP